MKFIFVKFGFCAIIALCLNSCFVLSHKFKITHDKIKSNHFFYQGFKFSEILVDSFDLNNVPIKFEKIKTAELYVKDSNKLKTRKTIYFYRPMTNYFWMDETKMGLSVLPIKMEKNKWYMIEGLVFYGNPSLSKFIYVDDKGNYHIYTKPITTNW